MGPTRPADFDATCPTYVLPRGIMLTLTFPFFPVSLNLWLSITFTYELRLKHHLCHWNQEDELYTLILVSVKYEDFYFWAFLEPPRSFLPTEELLVLQKHKHNPQYYVLHHLHNKCPNRPHLFSFIFVLRSHNWWIYTCIMCKPIVQVAKYMSFYMTCHEPREPHMWKEFIS